MPIELIASSVGTTTAVPADKFGQPGTPGELHFVAQLPGDLRTDDERMHDQSEREFKITGLLSKVPLATDNISASFGEGDGGSYLEKPPSVSEIRVATPFGKFAIKANSGGELSLVEFGCSANDFGHARQKFLDAVLPFLDHAAYVSNAPVFIESVRVEDVKNRCTTLFYTNPFRKKIVGSADRLFWEMAPVYGMYRESLNSNSNFYKFLCFYKILEGLLGPLRAKVMKAAREKNLTISLQKLTVPTSNALRPDQTRYVGTPIKKFFDSTLTPQYRNAVAHFVTDKGEILHASRPEHVDEYAGVVHICELCVREAIAAHEALLSAVIGV